MSLAFEATALLLLGEELAMETRDQLMSLLPQSQSLITLAWAWRPAPVGEAMKRLALEGRLLKEDPGIC